MAGGTSTGFVCPEGWGAVRGLRQNAPVAKPRTSAKALPAAEFAQRLAAGVPQVVVLAGAERFFREDGLTRIVGAVLPEGDPGGSLQRLDARRPEDREDVSAAVDNLRSTSLFGGGKVIAIDHPEAATGRWTQGKVKSPIAEIARVAMEGDTGDSVLVLLTPKPVKGKDAVPLKTLMTAGALVVDCRSLYDAPGPWQRGAPPHEHELARFVSRRMQTLHGKQIALPEAHALTRLVGSDLAELHDALASLALFVGDRHQIRTEDLHEVVGATRTDPAWHLVDAVFEGNVAAALDLLEQAFDRGIADARGAVGVRGDEALFGYLSAALHGQFRKVLAGAEGLAAGEDEQTVARGQGVPSFRTQEFLSRCRRDPVALLRRHRAFFEAEQGVKGGRVPARMALERLVVALARPAPGVPRRP